MKKFYLGMDIGTDSVGMACTDEEYKLLRAKGQDLWSVRLFEEAQSALDRRVKRTARRRLQRRRQRIEFLQSVFAPFMQDELFFIRLNNSGFYEEDKDKRLKTHFSLFADAEYTDADFYKEYPTIFHLRAKLMEDGASDLRLYYLALHHIIKYRGHFLFEGENMSGLRDIQKLFQEYNEAASEVLESVDVRLLAEKSEEFRALAMGKSGLNDKKKKGWAIFETADAAKKEMIALLLGAKAKAAVLFGADYADKYKDEKISLKELNDDSFEQLQETFDEEHFEILKKARAIYNFIVFEKVLEGNTSISKAMIRLYEKHAKDLSRLKKFVKENYAKEVYYKIFRSKDEKANYVNYIGYTRKKDKKTAVAKCNTVEEFYKFLKKTLLESEVLDENGRQEILFEIENETFLPKILNADNGLFPHQINGMELDLILNNLCLAHPEFNVKDESGYTAREKIEKIFRFKVPYFVGPLNANGKNGWIVRKAEGKITPWNFDEMVDKGASNEQFIRRMTNKCTYLHGKDVLPKGSMYYQAFDTLNQINKLTINGAPISVELKQELFKNVYLKNKKVGKKQIEDYLVVSGRYTKAEVKEVVLGGFDVEVGLKASMSSYVLFKGKFGDFVDERPEIFEEIILWHTLNTDKTVVEDMIKEKYADIPQIQEQIKWIKGLTAFKEFGRFSKELLCSLSGGVDPVTGEIYTLLHQLYHTNYNLNQLLNLEEYTFDKAIQAENSGESDEVKYSDVESLYVSPMVRRGIWQALQMADEYVKAVGRAPDKIFIEVTRQDGEKKRTVSRKAKLLELYRAIAKDCKDVDDVVKELNREDMTESRLRSERLYLYFLQLGRCAYTGERIDIEQLSTDLYDVDHIVPRSLIKDDSLENKVLVKREKNAQKTDVYPLPVGFTDQQESWRIWKKMGFMSEAKYARLTRTKPLSDDDFKDFVNRQLVVTNQMAKAVAELLERKYAGQGTKIVYSKAVRVDEFKQRTGIVKCRETNDLHHARDAYLNIVVGNIYDTKFTSAYSYYYQKPNDFWREYNLKHLFDRPILGAWSGAENIEFIKTTVQKTSMKVTRYAYCDKGKFYKETIYGKNDKSVSYPRKGVAPYNIQDDKGCYKYGGYSNVQGAYFVALEYADGKKRKKVILSFPVIVEYQAKGNVEQIKRYFEETEGLKDVKILVPKIHKDTLISYDGYRGYITGASDNRITFSNAVQWFSKADTDLYVKSIFKLKEMEKQGRIEPLERKAEQFEMSTNRYKKHSVVINRQNNTQLYETIVNQISLKIYQSMPAFQTLKRIMEEKREIFFSKSVLEQVKGLANIVEFLRRGGSNGLDLSVFGESAHACLLRVGYNITNVKFAIIHQSPCGLIERIQKV